MKMQKQHVLLTFVRMAVTAFFIWLAVVSYPLLKGLGIYYLGNTKVTYAVMCTLYLAVAKLVFFINGWNEEISFTVPSIGSEEDYEEEEDEVA